MNKLDKLLSEKKKSFEEKFFGIEMEVRNIDWIEKGLPKYEYVDITENVWQFLSDSIKEAYKEGVKEACRNFFQAIKDAENKFPNAKKFEIVADVRDGNCYNCEYHNKIHYGGKKPYYFTQANKKKSKYQELKEENEKLQKEILKKKRVYWLDGDPVHYDSYTFRIDREDETNAKNLHAIAHNMAALGKLLQQHFEKVDFERLDRGDLDVRRKRTSSTKGGS